MKVSLSSSSLSCSSVTTDTYGSFVTLDLGETRFGKGGPVGFIEATLDDGTRVRLKVSTRAQLVKADKEAKPAAAPVKRLTPAEYAAQFAAEEAAAKEVKTAKPPKTRKLQVEAAPAEVKAATPEVSPEAQAVMFKMFQQFMASQAK